MSNIENINVKVNKALDEVVLGCKVQKIKRDPDSMVSISYVMHPSIPREYFDDSYNYFEHEVQVDVWTDYEMSNHELVKKIIKLMEESGFTLVSVRADMYEQDTNIVHKPILFLYLEKIEKAR